MAKIQKWVADYWAFFLAVILSAAALSIFLLYKITSTPSGYSPQEWTIHLSMATKAYSLGYLWHHVAFAPYYIVLMIPEYLHRYGLLSIRGTGVFFGFISVIVFFYISWRWWGTLIAVLSTFLFTTSLWFLQVSRNSGPIVLYVLAALVLILLGFVVRNKKGHETRTLLSALIALVLLYIPGMIWFVLAAALLQRRFIVEEFRKLPTQVKFIIPLSGLIILIPLVHGVVFNQSELKTILGLPDHFSSTSFIRNLWQWPLILFIRTPTVNIFTIGRLPILSIFTDVMFMLGLYWIWLKRKLDRFYLLGATIVLSWVLYALGGPVSIYLSLPFIMCIAVTGVAFILSEWFVVFPKNPVARSTGIILVAIAIAAVCLFNVNEYFNAWAHSTQTIAIYSTHKR